MKEEINLSYNGFIQVKKQITGRGGGGVISVRSPFYVDTATLLHCRIPFPAWGSTAADGPFDCRAGVTGLAQSSLILIIWPFSNHSLDLELLRRLSENLIMVVMLEVPMINDSFLHSSQNTECESQDCSAKPNECFLPYRGCLKTHSHPLQQLTVGLWKPS